MPAKKKKVVEPLIEPELIPEPTLETVPPPPLSIEDKYKRLLEKNRERQKRYYAANKEKLKMKAREVYQHGRVEIKNKQKTQRVFTTSTYDTLEDILQKLPDKHQTVNFRSSVKTIFEKIFNFPKSFIGMLKKPAEVLKAFKNAKYFKENEWHSYATNSIKQHQQTIVSVITDLELEKFLTPKTHKIYLDAFDESKVLSRLQSDERQRTSKVMDMKDFLNQIEDRFGAKSKQFALFSLYSEAALRDNFSKLEIFNGTVKDFKAIDDKITNYIIIPKTGAMSLNMNKYKTVKKYGVLEIKLSAALSSVLRNYIKEHKIKDYLFGNNKTGLSSYISKSLDEANIKRDKNQAINYLRHMKASQLDLTAAERVKLSMIMAHSPLTSLTYVRKILESVKTPTKKQIEKAEAAAADKDEEEEDEEEEEE